MIKSIAPIVNDNVDELVIVIVPLKDGDGGFAKPARRHTIPSSFSKEELAALKKQDPFLYYSIPGVRTGTAVSSNKGTGLPSLSGSQSSITVKRRSCVSVECDVLHEMLDDYEKIFQSPRRRRSDNGASM